MGQVTETTTETFDEKVKEGVSLVDFWAPWCGPCRMIAPLIEELAGQYKDKVSVGKVNVDENQDLAARFGVRSVPTILFFKDGEQVDSIVGLQPKQKFAEKLDALIGA
ncbi:MAG: thioredoxin [Helicobacteraceae bacterium]|jgi:thioredoxin 1|nr:thioredoxin [Helicobacteraceae bacterium]